MLDGGVYGERDGAFRRFLANLRVWQAKVEKRTGKRFSRLSKGFSEKQLGPANRPFFKGKAAESRHMLGYVVEKLDRNVGKVQGDLERPNNIVILYIP
jgi:hypothetical protein